MLWWSDGSLLAKARKALPDAARRRSGLGSKKKTGVWEARYLEKGREGRWEESGHSAVILTGAILAMDSGAGEGGLEGGRLESLAGTLAAGAAPGAAQDTA